MILFVIKEHWVPVQEKLFSSVFGHASVNVCEEGFSDMHICNIMGAELKRMVLRLKIKKKKKKSRN